MNGLVIDSSVVVEILLKRDLCKTHVIPAKAGASADGTSIQRGRGSGSQFAGRARSASNPLQFPLEKGEGFVAPLDIKGEGFARDSLSPECRTI